MPHNITHFKVKELIDFRLNIESIEAEFFKEDESGIFDEGDLQVTSDSIRFIGENEIEGQLQENLFTVSSFDWYGEWSGTIWRDVLIPSFVASVGTIKAVLIWEGGEEIEQITVTDGVVKTEEIIL